MIENKTDDKATNYIENVKVTVENNWKIIPKKHGLSRNEIEYMSPAFNMEYKEPLACTKVLLH